MKRTHTVVVEQSRRWWNLTFPDVRFVYAQSPTLRLVKSVARRALAAKLDVGPDEIDVEVRLARRHRPWR
jgi:hypothetical protein